MMNPQSPILDVQEFVENYSDLKDVIGGLVSKFVSGYPSHIEKIRVAISTSDAEGLKTAAHSLKGALLQLYASAPAELAHELEKMGSGKNLASASGVFKSLIDLMPLLEKALEDTIKNKLGG